MVRKTLGTENGVKIGTNRQLVVAAYTDDLVVIAEYDVSLKDTKKNLLENEKKIRLTINVDKTKYMVVTRKNCRVARRRTFRYWWIRI